MPLDPLTANLLEQLRAIPALETLSPIAARGVVAAMTAASPPGPKVHSVENRSIETPAGSLGLRIYRPTARPTGIIVYYHGCGWVLGSLDSVDAPLRSFALQTQSCIVSVDYRLAPEHPFPAAVIDASYALSWVHRASEELIGHRGPVLVAGDSAGGNLATVVAILARDAGDPALAGQLLFYPVTDADFKTPSYIENGGGFFLTQSMMRWFWDHYVPDAAQRSDFRVAPMRTADLSRLAPAFIQTAEYDPLRDEGEAYARRLQAQGIAVTLQRRDGLIHGYFGMTAAIPAALTAVLDAANWVRATIAAAGA